MSREATLTPQPPLPRVGEGEHDDAVTAVRTTIWRKLPSPEPAWWDITTTDDVLAVEEPLEIRLAGIPVTVTMRTPGDDFDLATGFLVTEGILPGPEAIASIHHCPAEDEEAAGNIVNVNPSDPGAVDSAAWERNFAATSSCGVCGKRSIEDVRRWAAPIVSDLRLAPERLFAMARALRAAQRVFHDTGSVHAAGLFDVEGHLLAAREDVGRHNAVDKVVGAVLREGNKVNLANSIILVSSRASFEIVQKALVAGIPVVAAVSGASSLAVALAREAGMTLAGFLREDEQRFNVYAGGERICPDAR